MRVLVDDPGCFDRGSRLRADDLELVVAHSRPHKNTLLVAFENVTTRNQAEDLRDAELRADSANRRQLETGEYWLEDLVGLAVFDGQSRLGEVIGIVPGDVQDRLVIRTQDDRVVEIPFVDALVPEVSPDQGLIRVTPIEGLF